MVEIVVDVPDEIERAMREHKLMDWSKIAADALRQRIAQLELLEAIASESKLTEEDSIELGRKINKSLWENWYKKLA